MLQPIDRRLPNRAAMNPQASSMTMIARLRMRWSAPPALMPPRSSGTASSFPIATSTSGIDSEQTEYDRNAA